MERKTIQALIEDAGEKLVIDIRSEEDYKRETYPGAIHIFHENFMDELDRVPKDRPVYLICYTVRRVMILQKSCQGRAMRSTV